MGVNIDERPFRSISCGVARRDRRWQRQSVHRVSLLIVVFALWTTGFASAGQQPQKSSTSCQVPGSDSAKAQALANQLAAHSLRVDRNERKLHADCDYATVSQDNQEDLKDGRC